MSLVTGFLGDPWTKVLKPLGDLFPAGSHQPKLTLWHGFELPLLLSLVSVAGGLLLFLARRRFAALQASVSPPFSAGGAYFALMRGMDRVAVEVTGFTQRGSVATYVGVILLVVVLLPGSAALLAGFGAADPIRWDFPAQAVVALVIAIAAVATARSRRRLKAVVLVGVTGYGTSTLFLLHGAPDLALTQVLVETVTMVVFVLAMRRLPEYFTNRPPARSRYLRMAIGAGVAATVACIMLVATGARTATPVSADFPEEAYDYGGGKNIVNVTLVDIRAWDTMGEIAVLVAAATGVASLVFLRTRQARLSRLDATPSAPSRPVWLSGGRKLAPERRSVIFEVITRLVFHTVVVFSLYLLFTGHNDPGGGFAAGLVTGLALVVRYLAGGRYELDEAAPVDAGALMGTGLAIAALSGLAPLAFGGAVLQSAIVDIPVPVLGNVHLVTSVFFDIGVYVLVVGLVLDLLRSLGAAIDRQIAAEEPDRVVAEVSS